MFIWKILEDRGIRKDWLAEQLGVSPSYISKLKSGERRWTDKLRLQASRVLMLPEEVLFFDPECTSPVRYETHSGTILDSNNRSKSSAVQLGKCHQGVETKCTMPTEEATP